MPWRGILLKSLCSLLSFISHCGFNWSPSFYHFSSLFYQSWSPLLVVLGPSFLRASILSCLCPSCFLIERVLRPGRLLGFYPATLGSFSAYGWLSRFQSWSPLLVVLSRSFACFYPYLSLSFLFLNRASL